MYLLIILYFFLFGGANTTVVVSNDFAKLVQYDEKYVNITSFNFYKKNRNLAALNVTYVTMEDITSDDQTKVIIAALQFKGNEYKRTVIDFTIGICTIYRANKFDTMELVKNSNLTGCPFPKGGYYINDIAPTAEFLPPFFPEGKWLLDITFTMYGKPVARVHWMLSIIKKI